MEVVTTAVRKPEEEPKPEKQLTYRERVLLLAREKAVPLDNLEALKTDIFESDEELEEFIEDIYRYRRSFKA